MTHVASTTWRRQSSAAPWLRCHLAKRDSHLDPHALAPRPSRPEGIDNGGLSSSSGRDVQFAMASQSHRLNENLGYYERALGLCQRGLGKCSLYI
ncbi:hypothetical protein TIFTF001_044958 [Ficus carica]|uniref:Uncharacterized protein n=1 Tax=Ficus carica TaxID=3494 RepID=A0AA88A019_FICCA|nr:hypothetical protein TIFTF001_044958 [Ficus carica]